MKGRDKAMRINQRLLDCLTDRARQTDIELVCLGLGYTVVTTSDGGIGLAYTYFDHKTGCNLVTNYQDFEGRPARDLLPWIQSSAPLERSMALALINALSRSDLVDLPPDKDNGALFDALAIGPGTRVAMVGLFKPLMQILASREAHVEVIDEFRGIGSKEHFYHQLSHWAEAVLMTSTTLLNMTFEKIMAHVPNNVRTALLGPSTPMVTQAFVDWPAIKALAGTIPLEHQPVLKAVRHGLGTPYLHRHSKKVTLLIKD